MKFGLEQHSIDNIVSVFQQYAKVDKALVFGSRAKGNYRPDSDIDIAIKGYDLITDDIIAMSVALEEKGITPKIDLINYHGIKEPDLKGHIDRVGVELYSRWKEYKFREFLKENVRNGVYKEKEFHGRGVKIVNMGELFTHPRLTDVSMKRVELSENEKSKFLLQNGDLIFARRSLTAEGAGKCSLVFNIHEETTFESSIIRARIDQNIGSSQYLYYFFNSSHGKYLLGTILRQVAVSGITGNDLMHIELKIPPLNEQATIANILISLDDKIDLLQRQNKTLEQLAETLFRQWFLEEAEESWEVKSLPEIAEYLNGLALQKFPPKTAYLPVIKIREMKKGISENTERCSADIPSQYIIRDGDVLFSWSGSLDVVLWTGGEGALNQHLFKVSSRRYPRWFYYFATKYHLPEFKVIAESKSTTMGHIQREHLKQALTSIPPKKLFDQYDAMISPMFNKLIKNHSQVRTLTKLRDTILPKLMSGEARVKV